MINCCPSQLLEERMREQRRNIVSKAAAGVVDRFTTEFSQPEREISARANFNHIRHHGLEVNSGRGETVQTTGS